MTYPTPDIIITFSALFENMLMKSSIIRRQKFRDLGPGSPDICAYGRMSTLVRGPGDADPLF